MNDARTNITGIQREHFVLLRSLLQEERAALTRTNKTFTLHEDKLGASKIFLPPGYRYQNALEMKIYDAYCVYRQFWESRSQQLYSSLSALGMHGLYVQKHEASGSFVPKYGLLFDCVCIPVDFFWLDGIIKNPELPHELWNVVEWMDFCLSLQFTMSDHVDLPLVIFFPQWEPPDKTYTDVIDHLSTWLLSEVFRFERQPTLNETIVHMLGYPIEELNRNCNWILLNEFFNNYNDDSHLAIAYMANNLPTDLHKRVRGKNVLESDIPALCVAVDTFFWGTYRREREATIAHASPLMGDDEWFAYIYRNLVIEKEWKQQIPLPEDCILSRAISVKFDWLSSLSLQDVAVLRENNELASVRDMFRAHLRSLKQSKLSNLASLFDDFDRDVHDTFSRIAADHRQITNNIQKHVKKATASFGLTIALTVSSFVFPPFLPLAIISGGLSAIWGTASVKDLWDALRKKKEHESKQQASCFAFLLNSNPKDSMK